MEEVKGGETVVQLADRYEVHSGQVPGWKKALLDGWARVSKGNLGILQNADEAFVAPVCRQIGKSKMKGEF